MAEIPPTDVILDYIPYEEMSLIPAARTRSRRRPTGGRRTGSSRQEARGIRCSDVRQLDRFPLVVRSSACNTCCCMVHNPSAGDVPPADWVDQITRAYTVFGVDSGTPVDQFGVADFLLLRRQRYWTPEKRRAKKRNGKRGTPRRNNGWRRSGAASTFPTWRAPPALPTGPPLSPVEAESRTSNR